MNPTAKLVPAMLIVLAALSACKKTDQAAPAAVVVAPVAAPVETPAAAPAPAAAATPAPAAAATFDVNSVPMLSTALPPFPYLDWPAKLPEDERHADDELDFDATAFVAGNDLRMVEGRVQRRHYSLSAAKLSALAAERNYDIAMKNLGAVQINKVQPNDEAFQKAHPEIEDLSDARKAFKFMDYGKYKSYLLRTPKGNVWIAITIDDYNVNLVAVEEKAMEQSVKPLSAADMKDQLSAHGHVALYMNFDTDKAVILDKDKATIAQVGKLMADDQALKLKVEGHTDSSGDARRNQALSEQRARAVVASLVDSGVERTRLAALGLGGSKPVADNATEEGRARNRRVELVKQG